MLKHEKKKKKNHERPFYSFILLPTCTHLERLIKDRQTDVRPVLDGELKILTKT